MEIPSASGRTTGQNLHYVVLRNTQEQTRGIKQQIGRRVANREGREALRGAAEQTLDLLSAVLTSGEWAELLRAPLERAATEGNRGLAQQLMAAGAQMGNALHAAVRGGHEDVVNDLLERGASVAAKDTHGDTPLHLAARGGKLEVVQLLMLKGADKDAMGQSKCTPLYLAVCFGPEAVALALMADGANVILRCLNLKESVVHAAARQGHLEVLRAAMEHGADVRAVDALHYTAVHVAAVHNQAETIDVLVQAGASLGARNRFAGTPLFYAALHLRLEALLVLLQLGAGVNTDDMHGETPLHNAAGLAGVQGAVQVVDSLLRSGADETLLNQKGKAAADIVGIDSEAAEEDYLVEDNVERVRELLVNAPADRAWRRRGYLVLCRAHPDRMELIQETSSTSTSADVARKAYRGTILARAEASGGPAGTTEGNTANERTSRDWAGLVGTVLRLQEDEIFRTIIGFL